MKSQAKLYLVLALLFAVIFGITVISTSTPPVQPDTKSGSNRTGDPDPGGPPLASKVLEYKFDPKANDDAYWQRLYPGFFEIGTGGIDGRRNWVAYVLRNLRMEPVKILALPPGCSFCTQARAMVVDPNALREFTQLAAASQMFGSTGVPNPLTGIAWANVYGPANWHVFDFGNPKSMLTVPSATLDTAGKVVPQWLIVELDFRISSLTGPVTKQDTFQLFDNADNKLGVPVPMTAQFAGREPFECFPAVLNVGEIAEGVPSRTVDFYAFSMTRDSFPAPTMAPIATDPAVVIGTPVPLTADERETLAVRVVQEQLTGGGAIRIRSGYRFPVTIQRQPPGAPPVDIAEIEKDLMIANPTLSPISYKSTIRGRIAGAVRIDGATKIDFGLFKADFQMRKSFDLVTSQLDTTLELVPDRCEPKYVQWTLGKPLTEAGRRTWALTAVIPEQQGRRGPFAGAVVLRSTGQNPATYRFTVTGTGQ